jgi:hypothetical protein
MLCVSAEGDVLPPVTVYQSQSGNFYDVWATGRPPGSVFTANKSRWFNMKVGMVWMKILFEKQHYPTRSKNYGTGPVPE